MPHPDVSIIVPTYREAPNIRPLTERIVAALRSAGLAGEILFVDDRSPDGTADEVRAVAREHPVRLIARDAPRSLAGAVLDGFVAAEADILVVMDADLSHPPETIPALVRPVRAGEADFAIGSRYVERGATKDWPWLRRLNSGAATWLAMPLLGRQRVRDPMSGFFCLRKETWLSAESINVIGYKIGLELLVKTRCRRVVEVPITFADRVAGRSKLTAREQLRYLHHLKRLYEYRWPWRTLLVLFAAVAGVGLFVDLAVLNLLMVAGVAGFPVARAAGILAAIPVNFALHSRFTFRGYRGPGLAARFARYFASCLVGLVVNVAVAAALFERHPFFADHYNAAAIVGVAAGAVVNMLLGRYVVFPADQTPGVLYRPPRRR